jgi:hypothetical protein
VPDPRSALGRWHQLEYVLALAVCAFTGAGHDSPVAIAERAAGCSQETLALLGGRRDLWTRRIKAPSARVLPGLREDRRGGLRCRRITEAEHGHYLMIIKGNQPSLLDAVRTALAGPEAASPAVSPARSRSRSDQRLDHRRETFARAIQLFASTTATSGSARPQTPRLCLSPGA